MENYGTSKNIDDITTRVNRHGKRRIQKIGKRTQHRIFSITNIRSLVEKGFDRILSRRGRRQKVQKIAFLCLFSFLFSTPLYAKIRDIKIDPIHHAKVHNFKINPGVPLTLSFPYNISEAVYGDGKNYKIVQLDSKTLSIKVKNLNQDSKTNDNGFTVLFDNEKKISFILHPTSTDDYDITINFYEGSLPKNSRLAKKSQQLETEFEKKIEAYETGFATKIDEYISTKLQERGHLVKLKGEKRTHGVTFQSKKRFIVGDRVYYMFSVENNKHEKILPEDVQLKSFYLKSGKIRNIKLVETVKSCAKKILDQKEETLCTFAYEYPEDPNRRFMLEIITPTLKQAQMIVLK
jgi:hypothetical protein